MLNPINAQTPSGLFLLGNPYMTKETKGWTPERRAAQRARILALKPWEKSTGPKSAKGKTISSLNARKHGRYDKENAEIVRLLIRQNKFIKDFDRLSYLIRILSLKNELREKPDISKG